MADEPQAEPAARRKPAASPFRYLFLVIMILLLEAAVAYLFLDQLIPAREEAVEAEEEEEEPEQEEEAPPFYTKLTQIVISPASERGVRLVQLSLALEVDSEAVLEEITIQHEVLWDLALRKLESYSLKAVRDPDKREIREALKRTINAELKNGEVKAVYFTDIVVQ